MAGSIRIQQLREEIQRLQQIQESNKGKEDKPKDNTTGKEKQGPTGITWSTGRSTTTKAYNQEKITSYVNIGPKKGVKRVREDTREYNAETASFSSGSYRSIQSNSSKMSIRTSLTKNARVLLTKDKNNTIPLGGTDKLERDSELAQRRSWPYKLQQFCLKYKVFDTTTWNDIISGDNINDNNSDQDSEIGSVNYDNTEEYKYEEAKEIDTAISMKMNYEKLITSATKYARRNCDKIFKGTYENRLEHLCENPRITNTEDYQNMLLEYQQLIANNTIQYSNIFNTLLGKTGKRRTLYLHGPPNGGKSALLQILLSVYEYHERGKFGAQGIASQFWLADLPNKQIYIGDEIRVTPDNIDTIKMLFEGNSESTAEVKYGDKIRLPYRPVIVANNNDIMKSDFYKNEDHITNLKALNSRCQKYKIEVPKKWPTISHTVQSEINKKIEAGQTRAGPLTLERTKSVDSSKENPSHTIGYKYLYGKPNNESLPDKTLRQYRQQILYHMYQQYKDNNKEPIGRTDIITVETYEEKRKRLKQERARKIPDRYVVEIPDDTTQHSTDSTIILETDKFSIAKANRESGIPLKKRRLPVPIKPDTGKHTIIHTKKTQTLEELKRHLDLLGSQQPEVTMWE